MYYGAIGFIYDVKKGPFWEHSPTLYDISGVRAGWAKINKVRRIRLYVCLSLKWRRECSRCIMPRYCQSFLSFSTSLSVLSSAGIVIQTRSNRLHLSTHRASQTKTLPSMSRSARLRCVHQCRKAQQHLGEFNGSIKQKQLVDHLLRGQAGKHTQLCLVQEDPVQQPSRAGQIYLTGRLTLLEMNESQCPHPTATTMLPKQMPIQNQCRHRLRHHGQSDSGETQLQLRITLRILVGMDGLKECELR